jgi:hypothetical protein
LNHRERREHKENQAFQGLNEITYSRTREYVFLLLVLVLVLVIGNGAVEDEDEKEDEDDLLAARCRA